VNGKNYWRVAAAGFDAGAANGCCTRIKANGGQCLAYSASRVFPGQLAYAAAMRQAEADKPKAHKELASSR
jgi:hypothetical protein